MTDTAFTDQTDDARARRSLPILVWAQAVLGAQMPVHLILGGLAGGMLAENKALSTLPISMTVLGAMLAAPVISGIMGRWGRRTGFLIGAAAGALGGLVGAEAIIARSFGMLLGASLLIGVYFAAHNFYRFAAADTASRDFRPKAIAWVMAGGLGSAVLGPELVVWFKDWLAPVPFAGAYRAMTVLNLVGAVPLLFLDIPRPPRRAKGARAGRPWREILARPRVVVAMICAMVAYALMNLVMTSTPLAVVACGFATDDAAGVVRNHVLAMYLPSFLTGPLIARYRSPRVIAAGLVLLGTGALVALAGIELVHFHAALILMGVGWNFGFIGATTMLAGAHLPEERARVQGLNDFLVMGLVTVASFSSGVLMSQIGWQAVNLAMVPFLALAAAGLVWLMLTERQARA
ncbi:MAG TPA: MFS transporter [Thermohalobaculum sp.]|nr:MFS transporter [Thermohalobaculum sp.]